MSAAVAKRAPKKKGAKAYKLPDPIPAGQILTDLTKNQWILGTSIGVGGFGEIYCAAPYNGKTPKEYPNVIKIEPHGNGPLFVEMHFYMRNAKPEDIENWKKEKKLSALGMPRFISSGSHEYNKTKYRFVVMDRYGTDIWKLFENNNKRFPEHTVYQLALQIVDVLEYIHHKAYIHADIKGENLLLDLKSPNQVYLVDFGLASHYTTKAEYKLDPKKAHNGTLVYTSRDAHMGVPTMRADLEILGYNMILWLCGSLPWEKKLTDPAAVQKEKEKAFENISEFLKKCFSSSVPEPIQKYLTLLATLKFNDTPDYDKFRTILINGLKRLGHKPGEDLELHSPPAVNKRGTVQNSQKLKKAVTPQKDKKIVKNKIETLKSPRVKIPRILSPVKNNNLNDSTVGVVFDQKRIGLKDIQQALDYIESDEEYDIKIVKKAKLKRNADAKDATKLKEHKIPNRSRRKQTVSEPITDSESEVTSTGIQLRSRNANSKATTKTKGKMGKKLIHTSISDEDMFDD